MANGSAGVQGELWSLAAADWACFQEPTARPAWEHAIRLAGVGPGTRFLDVGCGAGGAAMVALRHQARVTGLDAAPGLLAVAAERAPGAKFVQGDIESLPFEDGSFDVVFACNSMQYATTPAAAVRELRRVVAPEGRAIVSGWGRKQDCEMETAVFPAVRAALPPPPPGTPQPLDLSNPATLDAMLHDGGLRIVADDYVDVPMEYPTMDDAWRAQRSAGPLHRAMRIAGEDKIRDVVVAAMKPYVSPSGMVRMRNKFRVVVTRPA